MPPQIKIKSEIIPEKIGGSDHWPISLQVESKLIQPLIVKKEWSFNKKRLQILQKKITLPEILHYMKEKEQNNSKQIYSSSPIQKLLEIIQKMKKNYQPFHKISFKNHTSNTMQQLSLDYFALVKDRKKYYYCSSELLNLNRFTPISTLENPENPDQILVDPLKIAYVLTAHYKPLYESRIYPVGTMEEEKKNQYFPMRSIPKQEIFEALKILKSERAVSHDLISDHLIQNITPESPILNFISLCINQIILEYKIPDEINCRRLIFFNKIPIQKKNDTPLPPPNIGKLRGIAISSIFLKCLEAIILQRLISDPIKIYCKLSPKQIGFLPQMETSMHVLKLVATLLQDQSQKKPVYLCFYDFRCAYDRIDHQRLFHKLEMYGIDSQTLALIKLLYKTASVQIGGQCGSSSPSPIKILRGTLQGSIISPILFNIYVNDILRIIEKVEGVFPLMYADDLVLIFNNKENIKKIDLLINSWCHRNFMEINYKKTQLMEIISKRAVYKLKEPIKGDDELIEWTDMYKYLGVIIDNKLNFMQYLGQIKDKLQKYLIPPKADLSIQSRIHLWKTYAFCCFNYGCCILSFQENQNCFQEFQKIYKNSIITALGLKPNTPSSILFWATGLWPPELLVDYHFIRIVLKLEANFNNDPNGLPELILTTKTKILQRLKITQQDLVSHDSLKQLFNQLFLNQTFNKIESPRLYRFQHRKNQDDIDMDYILLKYWCQKTLYLVSYFSKTSKYYLPSKNTCFLCDSNQEGTQQHYLDFCRAMSHLRRKASEILKTFARQIDKEESFGDSIYNLSYRMRYESFDLNSKLHEKLVRIVSEYIKNCHVVFKTALSNAFSQRNL